MLQAGGTRGLSSCAQATNPRRPLNPERPVRFYPPRGERMAVERFIVRRAKMVHVRVLEPDEGDLLHATVVALGEVAKFEVVFRRGERRHRRTNIRLRHVRERNNAVFATYVVHAGNRTSWAELESRFADRS